MWGKIKTFQFQTCQSVTLVISPVHCRPSSKLYFTKILYFYFSNTMMSNFLNRINHLKYFGIVLYHFSGDIKMRTWSWSSQQCIAWSECTSVQSGLCMALYLFQRLITFGSGRIRVNYPNLLFKLNNLRAVMCNYLILSIIFANFCFLYINIIIIVIYNHISCWFY